MRFNVLMYVAMWSCSHWFSHTSSSHSKRVPCLLSLAMFGSTRRVSILALLPSINMVDTVIVFGRCDVGYPNLFHQQTASQNCLQLISPVMSCVSVSRFKCHTFSIKALIFKGRKKVDSCLSKHYLHLLYYYITKYGNINI